MVFAYSIAIAIAFVFIVAISAVLVRALLALSKNTEKIQEMSQTQQAHGRRLEQITSAMTMIQTGLLNVSSAASSTLLAYEPTLAAAAASPAVATSTYPVATTSAYPVATTSAYPVATASAYPLPTTSIAGVAASNSSTMPMPPIPVPLEQSVEQTATSATPSSYVKIKTSCIEPEMTRTNLAALSKLLSDLASTQ